MAGSSTVLAGATLRVDRLIQQRVSAERPHRAQGPVLLPPVRPVGWRVCWAERFATSKVSNNVTSYANKIERLEEFDDVVLENPDWSEVFEKYDGAATMFYCDLLYVGKEEYYPVWEIDHAEFAEVLGELEGQWIVSYAEPPGGVDEYQVFGLGRRTSWEIGEHEADAGASCDEFKLRILREV